MRSRRIHGRRRLASRRGAGRCVAAAALAALLAGCASAPPAPPAPAITYEQQLAQIIRLEDMRVLQDPEPPPAPPVAPAGRGAPAVAPQPATDLRVLAKDPDARLRRRAAIAIGRVGASEGRATLEALLLDADPEVRQMAAFGLGLLGDREAVPALVKAVEGDESVAVRGRAAEALGAIGETSAAPAIGRLLEAMISAGQIANIAPDELGWPLAPEVEAWRLGLYALVRMKAADVLLGHVLDQAGQPRVRWWPAAFALRRIEDARAVPALVTLARGSGTYAASFAIQGLGISKQPDVAVPVLLDRLTQTGAPAALRVQAARALGRLGDRRAVEPLLALLRNAETEPALRLEAVTALGALKAPPAFDLLLDYLVDPWPTLRAAAFGALAAIDPDGFIGVLSAMDVDPDWTVRAAVATALGTLGERGAGPLAPYLSDSDQRVIPAALRALVAAKAPDAAKQVFARLESDDPGVRAAAATLLGELAPAGAAAALTTAYDAAKDDPDIDGRVAILAALVKMKADEARPLLTAALADRDWAVRLKARELLLELDPRAAAEPQRPAPVRYDRAIYAALAAPTVSPRAFIDTAKGTVEIALHVLDAPVTVHNFIELARKGFFNGARIHRVVADFVVQDGDPRGDGNGGPGYTIRDELNELPYLRGTVGMALAGPDTGGSQFFITHSPQPHLDARYTVFGQVVAGMDVVDRLQQDDVIQRIRVWDGVTMTWLAPLPSLAPLAPLTKQEIGSRK